MQSRFDNRLRDPQSAVFRVASVALFAITIPALQNRSIQSIAGVAGCKPESVHTASYETKKYPNLRCGSGDMLWTIFAILLILWLLGFGFHVAGSLIHLLLVIAVVVLLIELITGRRAAV
jgi:hypothetical protein